MKKKNEVKVKDLFAETKKAIFLYKEKVVEIDQQQDELEIELVALQEEMTNILLDSENAPISDRVYLRIRQKEVVQKTEIIGTLLEELEEERTALKLSFVPVYQSVLKQDRTTSAKFDATEIAEKYRYLLLTEIAEIGMEMRGQYFSIANDILEVFEDPTVKENYPRIEHSFTQEQYTPSLSWFENSIVSKQEAFSAVRGNLPTNLKQPKDVQ